MSGFSRAHKAAEDCLADVLFPEEFLMSLQPHGELMVGQFDGLDDSVSRYRAD
jgi:hypothetical protein